MEFPRVINSRARPQPHPHTRDLWRGINRSVFFPRLFLEQPTANNCTSLTSVTAKTHVIACFYRKFREKHRPKLAVGNETQIKPNRNTLILISAGELGATRTLDANWIQDSPELYHRGSSCLSVGGACECVCVTSKMKNGWRHCLGRRIEIFQYFAMSSTPVEVCEGPGTMQSQNFKLWCFSASTFKMTQEDIVAEMPSTW